MEPDRVARWAEIARQEGRLEGRQEGIQVGRQEGEVLLLQRQLRRRFGELPGEVAARLQYASLEQLEHWAERLLEVESFEELFDDGFQPLGRTLHAI